MLNPISILSASPRNYPSPIVLGPFHGTSPVIS